MPIEIKELHIKAVISGEQKPAGKQFSSDEIARLRKELIKDVTEKVLRILQQKNER